MNDKILFTLAVAVLFAAAPARAAEISAQSGLAGVPEFEPAAALSLAPVPILAPAAGLGVLREEATIPDFRASPALLALPLSAIAADQAAPALRRVPVPVPVLSPALAGTASVRPQGMAGIAAVSSNNDLASVMDRDSGADASARKAAGLAAFYDQAQARSGSPTAEAVYIPATEGGAARSGFLAGAARVLRRARGLFASKPSPAKEEPYRRLVMWVSMSGPDANLAAGAQAARWSDRAGLAGPIRGLPSKKKDVARLLQGLPSDREFRSVYVGEGAAMMVVQEHRADIVPEKAGSEATIPDLGDRLRRTWEAGFPTFLASRAKLIAETPGVSAFSEEGPERAVIYLDGSASAGTVRESLLKGLDADSAAALRHYLDGGFLRFENNDPIEPIADRFDDKILAFPGVSAIAEENGGLTVYLDGDRRAVDTKSAMITSIPGLAEAVQTGAVRFSAQDPVRRRVSSAQLLAQPGVSAVTREDWGFKVSLDSSRPAKDIESALVSSIPHLAEAVLHGQVRFEANDPVQRHSVSEQVLATPGVSAISVEKGSSVVYLDGSRPEAEVRKALSRVPGLAAAVRRGAVRFEPNDPVQKYSASAEVLATPGVSAISAGKGSSVIYLDGSRPEASVRRALEREIPGLAAAARRGAVRFEADPVKPLGRSNAILGVPGVKGYYVYRSGPTLKVILDGSVPAWLVEAQLYQALPGLVPFVNDRGGRVRLEIDARAD